MKITLLSRTALVLTIVAVLNISNTFAHDEKKPSHALTEQVDVMGRPGATKNITRTIAITLLDSMRFTPNALTVKQGETVRLRITNVGKIPHEFVLGTPQEIDEHAAMMRAMPDMVHTDASSARLAPGKTTDLIWQFTKPGKFQYVCLIAGHREAGMQGTITVTAPVKK
jgi:uncharacterized cupredoxin-like copper-binding protein